MARVVPETRAATKFRYLDTTEIHPESFRGRQRHREARFRTKAPRAVPALPQSTSAHGGFSRRDDGREYQFMPVGRLAPSPGPNRRSCSSTIEPSSSKSAATTYSSTNAASSNSRSPARNCSSRCIIQSAISRWASSKVLYVTGLPSSSRSTGIGPWQMVST